MTDDLFSEMYEERAAVYEFDALMTREQAEAQALLDSEAWREACEGRSVALMDSREARRAYLENVTKKRGQASGDRLRQLVEKNFKKIREEAGK